MKTPLHLILIFYAAFIPARLCRTRFSAEKWIKAEFDKSAQCRAKSTSDDCKVTIGNQVDAVVSSTSGDVSVRYIGEIGLEMALSSTSGDVSAVCGGINSKGKKKVQECFGDPDSKLKASTISGDIKVRDC